MSVENPDSEGLEAPVCADDGREVGRGVELLEDVHPQFVWEHGRAVGCGCVAMVFRYAATAAPPRRVGRVARRVPQRPGPAITPGAPKQDHFNAPLYTFKAFAIATAIVMSTATASVAGVMAYLDVRTVSPSHNTLIPLTMPQTTEFAAHMRAWVSQSMPLLTAKIYRHDPPPAPTPHHESRTPTTFDHHKAEQRLAAAFDNGGFDAWAEAAARELEAELEVERARKRARKRTS